MQQIISPIKNVYCTINFDGKRLSICGVDRPYRNGNCGGSCGQIGDELSEMLSKGRFIGEGWTPELVEEFAVVWKRWHLNDMRAGNARQARYLRENNITGDYQTCLSALKEAGLSPDAATGYEYGSAWKFEKIPAAVLRFLASLPKTTDTPAWV